MSSGGDMRWAINCITWAFFAGAVAGCSSVDGIYIREGIGTNLGTPELPEVSYLQDVYVGEICRQAGLGVSQYGNALLCNEVGMRPAEWATFVQAGMNDIDRRCDSYLAWIDNKRRWREPVLKQLHTTAAATAAILGLTGVGATPIAIVGTVFGFAQDSFVNFQSRLITEVDNAVIQSVVLSHQNEFRAKLAGVPIDNRPASIYLLRNYLRICMPFSIEMSISNTITTYHRGGPDALRNEPPLLTRAPIIARIAANASPAVIRVDRPPPAPPPIPPIIGGAITAVEKTISIDEGKAFQRMLCVSDAGNFGSSGSQTRVALRDFFAAQFYPRDGLATDTVATDADLRRLRNAQAVIPSCQSTGIASSFEMGLFTRPVNVAGVVDPMKHVSDIVSALEKEAIAVPPVLRGSTFGPSVTTALRKVIPQLRAKYNLPASTDLDRALYNRIIRANAPN